MNKCSTIRNVPFLIRSTIGWSGAKMSKNQQIQHAVATVVFQYF